jgi:hypothetical protein
LTSGSKYFRQLLQALSPGTSKSPDPGPGRTIVQVRPDVGPGPDEGKETDPQGPVPGQIINRGPGPGPAKIQVLAKV